MEENKRTYYALPYRLHHRNRVLLWYTTRGETSDGVAVTSSGNSVPVFVALPEAVGYAAKSGWDLVTSGDAVLHDLDTVNKWCKTKKRNRARHVPCAAFLEAWNLFADVSRSVGANFDADPAQTRRVYDKLFWGSNLPAITPVEKCYVPRWSGRELQLLHDVSADGLRMFHRHTQRF